MNTNEEDFFAAKEPAAIGVSFRRSGKVYYFTPNGVKVRQGDQVLAQTERGLDIGEVVFIRYDKPRMEEDQELKPLLRKATAEDMAHEKELQKREREARALCEQKILEHELPMKLIAADYTFDEQRLVFFFSAEGRVDFRALVRDLAETFRTRIELRQIGVRDQAKMVGGLGPCGRPLCCNAFLRSFDPVGIRVAKDQGLSLNPTKISGICDRLMCCLRYEHEAYCKLADEMPKVGETITTPAGAGKVRNVMLLQRKVAVQLQNDEVVEFKTCQLGLEGEAPPCGGTCGGTCAQPCEQPEKADAPVQKVAVEREVKAEKETTPAADKQEEKPARRKRRRSRSKKTDQPQEKKAAEASAEAPVKKQPASEASKDGEAREQGEQPRRSKSSRRRSRRPKKNDASPERTDGGAPAEKPAEAGSEQRSGSSRNRPRRWWQKRSSSDAPKE